MASHFLPQTVISQRLVRLAAIVLIAAVATGTSVQAQESTADSMQEQMQQRVPRFLLETSSGREPIDVDHTPLLQRRVALELGDVTLKHALDVISALSGLHLAYSDDLVPLRRRVHLQERDIAVAAALTDVLMDTGVDVIFTAGGRATLVKRIAQHTLEVVRGRVTSDNGVAIAGSHVSITMAPNRELFQTLSDSSGAFTVNIPNGTGDYLVHVNALGWKPFQVRIMPAINGAKSDPVHTLYVRLTSLTVPKNNQLQAVRVQAEREKPRREPLPFGAATGGNDANVYGVTGALPPELAGNIDALAATLPGVTGTANGISVLGLTTDQNLTTLNGMAFSGVDIPRGVRSTTSVTTNTYDPARGGFSGAQVDVDLAPASYLTTRRLFGTLSPSQFQGVNQPTQSGSESSDYLLDAGTTGELGYDKWFYNVGARAAHSTERADALQDLDAATLSAAGLSADSISRLRSVMNTLGLPLSLGGPSSSDTYTILGRIDKPAFDYTTFTPTRSTWGLVGFGQYSQNRSVGIAPLSLPIFGSTEQQLKLGTQGTYSLYYGTDQDNLSDTRSSISVSNVRARPLVNLPSGQVLLASPADAGNGGGGIESINFGGNGTLDEQLQQLTWETTNTEQFFWGGLSDHHGKIYFDSRFDSYDRGLFSDRLGSFSYASLADLAANNPLSFARNLTANTVRGGEWNGAMAVSDEWHSAHRLTLLYGARLDGNVFTSGVSPNLRVDSLFGLRTGARPNGVGVSPRLGFVWVPGTGRNGGTLYTTQVGQFYSPPRGVLRGGIGEFRGLPDPTLLAGPAAATGLLTGTQQLSCVGSAVPAPMWGANLQDPSQIPTACANGAGPTLGNAAPTVRAIANSYTPPESWRANLSWAQQMLGTTVTFDGEYSLNLHQASQVNLNFSDRQAFALSSEDGRPVFISAANIVSATGTVSPFESRLVPDYAQVLKTTSDLKSDARQIIITAGPVGQGSSPFIVTASYALTDAHTQTRGFDGTTFGDPNTVAWSRSGLTPVNQFVLQAGFNSDLATITFFAKVSSGLPFTPIVGSDINGDGLANDRAFIFDPSSPTTDTAVSHGLRNLLATGPGYARSCLDRQIGHPAGSASCEGPWTASTNARIAASSSLMQRLHLPRATAALSIANPLAGTDLLLHGSHPHGWGEPGFPDPVLYTVSGFNPVTQQYQYHVNQQFGNTRATSAALINPFQISLDISIDLGRPPSEQQLDRWLEPGRRGNRGARLDSSALLNRYQRSVQNPYPEILALADSLLLSRDQFDSLTVASQRMNARIDSVWSSLAGEFAALPDDYDVSKALMRQEEVTNDVIKIEWENMHVDLPRLLNKIQLRLLPFPASYLFNAPKPPPQWYHGI